MFRVQAMNETRTIRRVVINNEEGLHARPASLFTKLAGRFQSDIEVTNGTNRVDGKSMVHVLTLAAEKGTELEIEARGPDADEALDALVELVESNFTESTENSTESKPETTGK